MDSFKEIQIFKPTFLPGVGIICTSAYLIYAAIYKKIYGSDTERVARLLNSEQEGLADFYDAIDQVTADDFINTEVYYKRRFHIQTRTFHDMKLII